MNTTILERQIAYYRARAHEYDRSLHTPLDPALAHAIAAEQAAAEQRLLAYAPCDQVLGLACGTGQWTRTLVQIGRHVTALDAAPEMLALNRGFGSLKIHSGSVFFHLTGVLETT